MSRNQASESTQLRVTMLFLFIITSTTNWAQIFTGLLFYALIHQVRRLGVQCMSSFNWLSRHALSRCPITNSYMILEFLCHDKCILVVTDVAVFPNTECQRLSSYRVRVNLMLSIDYLEYWLVCCTFNNIMHGARFADKPPFSSNLSQVILNTHTWFTYW